MSDIIFRPNESKLKQITEIRQQLATIKDIDILLENTLTAARKIANADAGSIYDYDEAKNQLKILYSQNDTQQRKLAPGEKLPYVSFIVPVNARSISGYSAFKKTTVNIPDVYNMDEYIMDGNGLVKRPYNFDKVNDITTGYHTQSMLTMPFSLSNGSVPCVMQIINAMDEEGRVIPFSKETEFYISYFAESVTQVFEQAYFTKQLIERLVKMANYRDPRETGAHVERVSSFSLEIYDRYAVDRNIPEKERNRFRDNLKLAAKCHDVGKVAVSDKILKKQGLLTDEERAVMKGHTCIGAQIFTPVETELDRMARDVCLHHHDRWEGGPVGYPSGFDYNEYEAETMMPTDVEQLYSGDKIPLAARIVALADVYDALRHRRYYKAEWSLEDTLKELRKEAGHQFDPDLVEAFIQVIDRIEAINSAIS
ncbi:MAG: HD domain-containing protein [Treponema sp.]|nr:HD domain-containing protein [Treponema sp.]